ncbi:MULTISPECIES: glycosyltransferase [Trueperella]|nr:MULTISPECIES: glycosyltransferase [Trueperella]MDV6238359.1 glycosyltransferase [Trueperella bernardiae]OFS67096.1 hypothetical protein HMPREF3174_04760 [Trueperella sp. HMSC08H06]WIM08258.1 glycosyltransferase [Trueperella bernardiae]
MTLSHALWVPSWYPTPESPHTGSFFAEQVAGLRSSGLRVGVIVAEPRSWKALRSSPLTIDQSGIVATAWPTNIHERLPGEPLRLSLLARRLAAAYEQTWGKPQVLHAHSVFPGALLARELAKIWDVPYVLTEHRPSSLTRRKGTARFRAIDAAVQRAHSRWTVSNGMAQEFTAFYGAPFSSVAPPAHQAFFDIAIPQSPRGEFTFVHVSSLDDNKRTALTIRAFAKVCGQEPHVRLRIAGGSPDLIAAHANLAASLRVSDRVDLLGPVARADVPALMAASDCHVLVSATESGGTVFSEAQATGLPSIASATPGGLFQTVPGTGVVIPIDDEPALVAAMADMVHSTSRYDRAHIREIARSRVSMDAFVRTLRHAYDAAIEDRS